MPKVNELCSQIMKLKPNEFEELAEWFMFRNFPFWRPWLSGIVQSQGVCGGEPRVVRTRIPVWVLEQTRRLGLSEAEILRSYPNLRAEDLVHAWAYVDLHREEIDDQIRVNEEA